MFWLFWPHTFKEPELFSLLYKNTYKEVFPATSYDTVHSEVFWDI